MKLFNLKSEKSNVYATWFSAIGTWAQVVAAVASTVLAWQAVDLAQKFRAEDRINTEIQNMPFLAMEIDTDKAAIKLKNNGLGPAVVNGVGLRIDSNTYLIGEGGVNPDNMKSFFDSFLNFAETNIEKEILIDIAKQHSIDRHFVGSTSIPLPGRVVPKDSEIDIVKIDLKDFFDEKGVTREDKARWMTAVQRRSPLVNLEICYCSFTGKSCFVAPFAGNSVNRPISSCKKQEVPPEHFPKN